MLSELQTQKLTRLFNVVDLNKNGVLDVEDYKIILRNSANIRGWKEDSQEYQDLYEAVMSTWEKTKAMSSAQNEKVTKEEWLNFYDSVLQNKVVYAIVVTDFTNMIFDLYDSNKDGKLQLKEYVDFFQAYQLDQSLAEETFPKLDTAGQGYLTREEILELVDQFYKSDDPSAKGNLLFGPY